MFIDSPEYKYYVYAYISSKSGLPYYIGKGYGKRAFVEHGRIKVPKNLDKIIFIEQNLSNIGALALERRLIKWYGKRCDSTGILLNLTDGGEGNTFKYKLSGRLICPIPRYCKNCNSWFSPINGINNVYCSIKCAALSNLSKTKRKTIPMLTKLCVFCNAIFNTKLKHRKFCTRSCVDNSKIGSKLPEATKNKQKETMKLNHPSKNINYISPKLGKRWSLEQKEIVAFNKTNKAYKATSPEGKIYIFSNVSNFTKMYKLSNAFLGYLTNSPIPAPNDKGRISSGRRNLTGWSFIEFHTSLDEFLLNLKL